MDEPVFDLTLKMKCRKMSPMFYNSVLSLAVFFCIPNALMGILLLVIVLSGEMQMFVHIEYVLLAVVIEVMIIGAVFGIKLWVSEINGHYVFYDEYFEVLGDKSKFTSKYSEILKVCRKKGFYYFYLSDTKAFVIGGINNEDTAAFEDFITSKTGVLIENKKCKEFIT